MTRHPDTYGEVGPGGEAILPLAHLRKRFGASNTDGIQVNVKIDTRGQTGLINSNCKLR